MKVTIPDDYDPTNDERVCLISYKKMSGQDFNSKLTRFFGSIKRFTKRTPSEKKKEEVYELDKDETHDWWSKYYASLEVNLQFPPTTFFSYLNSYICNIFLLKQYLFLNELEN